MAELIPGREIATRLLKEDLIPRVQALKARGITPRLVVLLVGDNAASLSYIRQKEKSATQAGLEHETRTLPPDTTQDTLLREIQTINDDPTIHGVIVQLPLPDSIDPDTVIAAIDPRKDVDGFTPENVGRLLLGQPGLQSCTPKGIIKLLKESGTQIEGAHAVVLGRSNIVGKPMAALLLNENATVTVCHSRTQNMNKIITQADILVVAIGKPQFVTGEYLKPDCTVIDVGIHRQEDGTLCGDMDAESAKQVAGKITPVPGGVGPMTVYCLIENTIQAAEITA